jgi:predicted acetylornithine/succinylornithine family transaminase
MSALMPTYGRYPVRLVRGKGLEVWDDQGNTYLDFAGGIAAVPIGHGHPAWFEAVTAQAADLAHVSNLFHTDAQERLAVRLLETAGMPDGRVFLSNSGAEANEAALKLTRLTGRPHVVTLEGSFHGRTFATLAATGQPAKGEPFRPLPEGYVHVPPEDISALEAAVDERTAAVLLEPVLGEGGVIPLDPSYLRAVRSICDQAGALLILDEVQTGVGRTGAWWAFQRLDVVPDIFTSAKALAGGLPIGATVAARSELAFGPGQHASTFGGGPVPCAGALAVLDVIEEEGLLENARTQGARLLDGVAWAMGDAGIEGAPRGLGLLIGAPVSPGAAKPVVLSLIRSGFLVTEAGPDVIRISPPLTVDAAAVDAFVESCAVALREAAAVPAETPA